MENPHLNTFDPARFRAFSAAMGEKPGFILGILPMGRALRKESDEIAGAPLTGTCAARACLENECGGQVPA